MSRTITEEAFADGCAMMAKIYGYGRPACGTFGQSPFLDETIGHLHADIWSRPGLSLRDRRLLALGATAMNGREDLIEIQVKGALVAGEFDKAELDEIVLQLAFYAGWGNATAVMRGIQAALASYATEVQPKT